MTSVNPSNSTSATTTQATNSPSNSAIDRNGVEYQKAYTNTILETQRRGMLEAIAQLLKDGKISKAQYEKLRDEINQFIDSSLEGGVSPEYQKAAEEDFGNKAQEIQKIVQEAVVKDITENGGLLSEEMKAKLKPKRGAKGGKGGEGGGGVEGAGQAEGGGQAPGGSHGTGQTQGSSGVEGVGGAGSTSRSTGSSSGSSNDGISGGWLTLLAKAFGKVLGDYVAKMTRLAQEIEGLNDMASQLDHEKAGLGNTKNPELDAKIQDVARKITEKTMELQGVTQMFNILQTAFSTVIKTIGEGETNIVRKN